MLAVAREVERPVGSMDRHRRPSVGARARRHARRGPATALPPAGEVRGSASRSAGPPPAGDRAEGDQAERDVPSSGTRTVVRGWRPRMRCRRQSRVAARASRRRCSLLIPAEHAAALQAVQQGEGGDDQDNGGDGHHNECHERGLCGAGSGQRHRGARQQHRVLGHAPAPDGGDGPGGTAARLPVIAASTRVGYLLAGDTDGGQPRRRKPGRPVHSCVSAHDAPFLSARKEARDDPLCPHVDGRGW